jgi:Fur family transcriptional regulator, iron response regulator
MESFGIANDKRAIAFDWRAGPLARMIRSRLEVADLRPTRQRVSLAGLLFVGGVRHVTAEQLYQEAKALRMPLSLATVYNTLRNFVSAGMIREIAVCGSTVWYDTRVGPHCHYFDEDRSLIYDIPYDVTRDLKIVAPPGRGIVGVDVIVRLRDDDEVAN